MPASDPTAPAQRPANVPDPDALLSARGIVKRFGHVEALRGADFDVYPGEIVGLVGDNGAGKSTLVKILSGAQEPDAGQIAFSGHAVTISSPQEARRIGIETVYQDLALADELDPPANLFLGREIARPGLLGRIGFIDKRAMREQAARHFAELGVKLAFPTGPVAGMSGGQRQGVAVARAMAWASKVVFMDEPTAALGVVQTRAVLDLILRVRAAGLAVVLISHSMPEVLEVADRVEVLRLGTRVAQLRGPETSTEEIVAAMTGATRA